MELLDTIYNRRTVRTFTSKPVSEETINEILEAGTWAPSHYNAQPWEFVIIGPETRQQLAAGYRGMMEDGPLKNPALPEDRKNAIRNFIEDFGGAPILMAVVCPPASTDMERYDYLMAAASAIQNIFLAAWEKQIAGVWLSYGYTPAAHEILKIQSGSIAGILALGYSDNIPPAQPRIKVNEKIRRLP